MSITLTISQLKKVGEAINQTEIESIQFALPQRLHPFAAAAPSLQAHFPALAARLLLTAPHSSSKRLKPTENKFNPSGLTSGLTCKFHQIQKGSVSGHCLHCIFKLCQIAAGMSMNFIFGGFVKFGTTVRRTLSRTLVAKQKCNLRSTHSVLYAEGS